MRISRVVHEEDRLHLVLSEVQSMVLQVLIEFMAVMTLLSGTMYVLEVAGDPPGYEDRYLPVGGDGMGAVSFFQMVYYTFITMSTVGYGDYSPDTVFGRLFIFVSVSTVRRRLLDRRSRVSLAGELRDGDVDERRELRVAHTTECVDNYGP